jgi:hypothetical protein
MSVTPDIVKEHFETDLADAALQRIIDAEDKEITSRYGSNTSLTEPYTLETPDGQPARRRYIWTKQKISSITSVKEGVTFAAGDLTTLVVTTDYRILYDGRLLERVDTNFLQKVEIIYVPATDVKRRDMVTIDLVKLAIQNQGLKSEKVGDYSATFVDYQQEREKVLSTLNSGRRSFA